MATFTPHRAPHLGSLTSQLMTAHRLNGAPTAAALICGSEPSSDGRVLGITAGDLDRAAESTACEIVGPVGSDRCGVALALHRRSDSTSPLLIVDGASAAAGDWIASLAREWAQGSGDAAIFVDNVDALSDSERATVSGWIRSGTPRVMLGTCNGWGENLISIRVTPLARRRQDIDRLVAGIMDEIQDAPTFSSEALALLRTHEWTFDVTELRQLIQRAIASTSGNEISARTTQSLLRCADTNAQISLADVEREHIYRVLEANAGNRTRSAKALGIDVKTLYNKLKRYDSRAQREAQANT